MRDKMIVLCLLLSALMLISVSVVPAMAWTYPDGSGDGKFELFGPRIDRILITMYGSDILMWTALQGGEIDITDWPLTKAWITAFTGDPNVRMLDFGGEAGYYTMSYNMNPNPSLGNPQNPVYPNPIYPNPTSVVEMRQALSHLIDRVTLVAGPGMGMFADIYTPIPKYMGAWIHPQIHYGGLLAPLSYPPDPSAAANKLTAGGFLNTSDGAPVSPRYWDRNGNGKKDAGEDFKLIVYGRFDALRAGAVDMMCEKGAYVGLSDPLIDVAFDRYDVTGGEAWLKVMCDKNYNTYSAGWIFVGPDPDFLRDSYHVDNYYHPEDPQNFGCVNDTILNMQSDNIKFAPNVTFATTAALAFQVQFAQIAAETPLASTAGPKAYSIRYTGGNDYAQKPIDDGENKYRNLSWTHLINESGLGINSFYTTLNAYPEGYYFGDGKMTMRYGFKEPDHPATLNPLYSSWYWEFEVIDRCYDYLGRRSPITRGAYEVPHLAENWEVGTWVDPEDGKTKSKITVKIRPDVTWQDGTPFTAEDVYFTFIELPKILEDVGAPATWWDPATKQMKSFYIIDPYTVEILLKVQSVWAVGWVIGTIVVPKHIWKPLALAGPLVVSKDLADPKLIGTGGFKFVLRQFAPTRTCVLVRNPNYHQTIDKCVNKLVPPGGIVIKEVNYTGKTPPTTPHIFKPHMVKPSASARFPMGDPDGTVNVTIEVPISNLGWDFEEDINKTVVLKYPDGSSVTVVPETNIVIGAHATHIETLKLANLGIGKYTLSVTVEIASGEFYDWVMANLPPANHTLYLGPRTISKNFWVGVPEDINVDFIVDIEDVYSAALAYGSYPGHARWSSICDLTGDYFVDIEDLFAIALRYGWA